jgi:DNA repair photolyase
VSSKREYIIKKICKLSDYGYKFDLFFEPRIYGVAHDEHEQKLIKEATEECDGLWDIVYLVDLGLKTKNDFLNSFPNAFTSNLKVIGSVKFCETWY